MGCQIELLEPNTLSPFFDIIIEVLNTVLSFEFGVIKISWTAAATHSYQIKHNKVKLLDKRCHDFVHQSS